MSAPVPPGWQPQAGDFVWVEEGRFKGCILTYVEKAQYGGHICRNDGYGHCITLSDGSVVTGIRTRKVALYLTRAEVERRLLGERIEGRPHVHA